MRRRQFIAGLACSMASLPAMAQSPGAAGLAVAAYTPQIGQRRAWQIEIEGSRLRSGQTGPVSFKTALLVQHMTVLQKMAEGYSIEWDLLPKGEAGVSLLEILTSLYGTRQISLISDLAGKPQSIVGLDDYQQSAAQKLASASPLDEDSTGVLQRMLGEVRGHAAFDIHTLTPAAAMIGRGQSATAWSAREGGSHVIQDKDYAWGAAFSGDFVVNVQGLDLAARTVTLTWTCDIPLEKLPASIQSEIDATLSRNRREAAIMPMPLRSEATSAQHRITGRAVISADDGATLSVEETRTLRIGHETTLTVMRAKPV